MYKQMKENLINKVHTAIEKSEGNDRVTIKNFSSISSKKAGNFVIFHHPAYNNVNSEKRMDVLNEEEDTDFLVFEANSIYIDYSDNLFTFHKIREEEKLIILDLNNQDIKNSETSGEENLNLSEELQVDIDMITLNYFPISISHSYLTICHEQNFAQVLSNEIILKMLQLFTMTENNSLRIGFNSLGAGCIINHLHFEILFLDDFQNLDSLPLEQSDSKKICSTFLKYLNEDEISVFDENTSILLSAVDYPVKCWKIQAFEYQEDAMLENNFQNSIAHYANMISTRLLDSEIPHNLVISDKGRIIYIIPRKFDNQNLPINTCWNDLAGLVTIKQSDEFQEFVYDPEKILNIFKEHVSLKQDDFDSLTESFVKLLGSIYVLEKF